MSRTSLQRLMTDLNWKPYRPILLQALNENDPDRRLEFCAWVLGSIQDEPTLLDRILRTNEAALQTLGNG